MLTREEVGSGAGYRKLTKSEWQAEIAEWERSKLSQTKFCKARDLSYASFTYWRTKFRARTNKKTEKRFIPVRTTTLGKPTAAQSPGLLLYLPSGVTLRVGDDTSAQTLSMVLGLLGVIPC